MGKTKPLKVHLCHYDFMSLEGDVPEDGHWGLFISKDGICDVARYNSDTHDHFSPYVCFKIEDAIAWIDLKEIRDYFKSKGANWE